MMDSRRFDAKRVVVTGIGLVTPFGSDRETSWLGLCSGRSATRWLDIDDENYSDNRRGRVAGLLAGAPSNSAMSDVSDLDPVVSQAVTSAAEAIDDANIVLDDFDRNRIGCVIGTSKGGLRSFARLLRQTHSRANSETNPQNEWNQFQPNAAASTISQHFDLRGPALCPVAACATGLASLVRGADLIRDDYCDVVLAGSTDASLQEAILASFHRMGVLANGFDDPRTACRPFDRNRSGFLVGEGAAVFVMEDLDFAIARRARPYAEWMTAGLATDHSGITRLDEQATSLTRLIQDVLRRADLTSDEIDYINLHGTATIPNDVCETRALKAALGMASRHVRCSSVKGAIGHLLGAAGSVEMAATLLAMRDGVIPPTINLQSADEQCDLDYTPLQPQRQRIENALKLSLGFGGHLVAAAVRGISFQ